MTRQFLKKYYKNNKARGLSVIVVNIVIFIAFLSLCSCIGRGKAPNLKNKGEKQVKTSAVDTKPCFTPPAVPAAITDQNGRADYLVLHWWDHFNFSDTACINHADAAEQAFVDFINILTITNEDKTAAAIRKLFTRAGQEKSGQMYRYFWKTAEKYLYDPNSPMRNEEQYEAVLEYIIADSTIDSLNKIRPVYQLEQINKNRVGMTAANFTYTLPDGKKGTLHGIKADYTLLYFYNPDCQDCQRTKEVLEHSPLIAEPVNSGKMKILAFYPDEGLAAWEAYRTAIPSEWINARDGSRELTVQKELYAVRAVPSIYLLDRNKKVILKDASVEQVTEILYKMANGIQTGL